jgi:hypothetical protein
MLKRLPWILLLLVGCQAASDGCNPKRDDGLPWDRGIEAMTYADTTMSLVSFDLTPDAVVDVTGGTDSATCEVEVTDATNTVTSAGCVVVAPSGKSDSCTARSETADVWSCTLYFEVGAEVGAHPITYAFSVNDADEHATESDLSAWPDEITVTSPSPDTDGPSITAFSVALTTVNILTDPNEIECNITVTDVSGVKNAGCSWDKDGVGISKTTHEAFSGDVWQAVVPNSELGVFTLMSLSATDTLGNKTMLNTAEVSALPGDTEVEFIEGSPTVLWSSTEQSSTWASDQWNFEGYFMRHPGAYWVPPESETWPIENHFDDPPGDEANGTSMSRVVSGGGFAMRHYGNMTTEQGGADAEVWITTESTPGSAIKDQFDAGEIWIYWERFIPGDYTFSPQGSTGSNDFVIIYDMHTLDSGGANRTVGTPRIHVEIDPDTDHMKPFFTWPDLPAGQSSYGTALPVGQWFEMELQVILSTTTTGAARLYVDNVLSVEQTGIQTLGATNTHAELYWTQLGGTTDPTYPTVSFAPTDAVMFTRNASIADLKQSDGDPGDAASPCATCTSLGFDCDVGYDPVCHLSLGSCGTCAGEETCTDNVCGAPPAPSSDVFPLQVSSNGRTFEDKNGDPWLLHAEAGWAIGANLCQQADLATCPDTGARDESIDYYLDDLVTKGFNTVLLNYPEIAFTDHSPLWENAYGDSPFNGGAVDMDDINESSAYWTHLEYILSEANDRDLLVILAPYFLGFTSSEGFIAYINGESEAILDAYTTWYCGRFGVYPNVAYAWGGDVKVSEWTGNRPAWEASMAADCALADTDALHMFHTEQDATQSAYSIVSASWLDIRANYSNEANTWNSSQGVGADYGDSPTRPTILYETTYENAGASEEEQRASYWLATLAGGRAGVMYGNENIWTAECDSNCSGFKTDNDWVAALGDPVRLDMAHLDDVMKLVNWENLEPINATALNAYARDTSDNWIVAYTENGVLFNIDTSALNGTEFDCVWYDPTDGSTDATAPCNTTTAQSGATAFAHTANNSATEDDWAVIITAVAGWVPDTALDFYATRTDCMQPCLVQFNVQEEEGLWWASGADPDDAGLANTHGDSVPYIRDTEWEWDFDNDGIVDEIGFIAYHVFETADTHAVKVRDQDGNVWQSKTITVSDPGRTICVSIAESFGDCPSADGGDHFATVALANVPSHTNVHVLYHRGESYSGGFDQNEGPTLYGAYGSGAKPIFTNTSRAARTNNVWQDLDITVSESGDAIDFINADFAVWRRLDLDLTSTGGVGIWMPQSSSEWAIVDCAIDITQGQGNGIYVFDDNNEHDTFAGNTFDSTYTGGSNSHGGRFEGTKYLLFQDNDVSTFGSGQDADVTFRGSSEGGDPTTYHAMALIQGNTFNTNRIHIKPQFNGANEHILFSRFNANFITGSAYLVFEPYGGGGWTDHWLVTNNVMFNGSIMEFSNEAALGSDMLFYNNTAYTASLGSCSACTEDNNVTSSSACDPTPCDFESVTPGDPDFMQPTSSFRTTGNDVNIFLDYHGKTRPNPPDDGAVEVP